MRNAARAERPVAFEPPRRWRCRLADARRRRAGAVIADGSRLTGAKVDASWTRRKPASRSATVGRSYHPRDFKRCRSKYAGRLETAWQLVGRLQNTARGGSGEVRSAREERREERRKVGRRCCGKGREEQRDGGGQAPLPSWRVQTSIPRHRSLRATTRGGEYERRVWVYVIFAYHRSWDGYRQEGISPTSLALLHQELAAPGGEDRPTAVPHDWL